MLAMFKRLTSRPASKGSKRRRDLAKIQVNPALDFRALLHRPEFLPNILVMAVFVAISSLLVISAREGIKVYVGQIVEDTRLVRIDFRVADENATQARREEARRDAPRIYSTNETFLKRLEAALTGLPRVVEGRSSLEGIRRELVGEFGLTEEALAALQAYVADGEPTEAWTQSVKRLIEQELHRTPLVTSQEYQRYTTTLNRVLRQGSGEKPLTEAAIQYRSDEPREEVRNRLIEPVRRAGFSPAVVMTVVASRIAYEPNPTIVFDEAATSAAADAAASSVEIVYNEYEENEPIYQRGDVLSPGQLDLLMRESEEYFTAASGWRIWPGRVAIIGLMVLVAAFMIGYVMSYYPRIAVNPLRLLALAALICVLLMLATSFASSAPRWIMIGAVSSTLFAATFVLVAYDDRLALWMGFVQALLVTIALEASVMLAALLFAGAAIMIIQLHDVRHRNTLIRAGAVTALIIGVATIVLGLLDMPSTAGALDQLFVRGVCGAIGAASVGFIALGGLPYLEKWFDITTGMTLAELRDTKQPLLRELQQKAPGTYNHSLQVANIAEAAAESIGANGLLTYVGGLYHDIGKMNKPAYFVENQAGGYNKHQKLSPAMSLLVIIGHVKDGMELARKYGLPRPLHHFIESHHGTTLVQYFYHAAKTQAELDDKMTVSESEFRYPGPKPRTKEAAILMLTDCVESATRAIADPNPSRIETLVRTFARDRLTDGQFDQCDLTFRELNQIEDSIIKSLCAIYHGRISYPSARPAESPPAHPSGVSTQPPKREVVKPASA